ncbi:hypothetical protein WR25_02043 [Diploscapter pachys]|uniref:Uncharacterized protein n=1 Tax=Diploscapter pachys TaxID=2018661 RepID=A0A2A2K9Q0_9BILA|nr:hypothetical protein WR25_02043 [Diploscapter pachys]
MWSQNAPLTVQGSQLCKPQRRGSTAPPTVPTDKKQLSQTLPIASVAPQSCPCQHSIPSAPSAINNNNPPLVSVHPQQQQYVRSLEQQIQLLELENNFLKRDQSKSEVVQKTILTRGNEVSLNGRDWCSLPASHPPLHSLIAQRIVENTISTPPTRDGKRSAAGSQKGSAPRRTPIAEEDEYENGKYRRESEKIQEEMKSKIDNLKKHNAELKSRLEEAEKLLSSRSEGDVREKRALIEENLELQMRLDELTPVIAEKESSITKLEAEKDELLAALRRTKQELTEMKHKQNERLKEDELRSGRELRFKEEKELMKKQIEDERQEKEQIAERGRMIMNEMNELKKLKRELEIQLDHEKIISHQLLNENKKLIEENAQLTTDISKLQYEIKIDREKEVRRGEVEKEIMVNELRMNVQAQRTHIEILEEKLRAAEERHEMFIEETKSRNEESDDVQRERLRIQKELNALQALASSLSAENRLLREEKSRLQEKLLAKELAMKKLEDEINDTVRSRGEALEKAEEESRAREIRAQELMQISRKLQQISSESASSSSRHSTALHLPLSSSAHHCPPSACGMAPPISAHSSI